MISIQPHERGSWLTLSDLELGIGVYLDQPDFGVKWIAGTTDTIRWTGGSPGHQIALEFSTDSGTTYQQIALINDSDTGRYAWEIPDTILTTKAMVRVKDVSSGEYLDTTETFKIKPYVITKLDASGQYIPYDITMDRWGFGNTRDEMWPYTWWNNFDYQSGEDPFLFEPYSQVAGGGIFASAKSEDFPDWESFVNAFGMNACYSEAGIYKLAALNKWKAVKDQWRGSCFGIAIADALAFEKRAQFRTRYPGFPNFINPSTVLADNDIRPVITELFTHQYGNPHRVYRYSIGLLKTPTQTLNDLKAMLIADDVEFRTLSLGNNNGSGGHAIVAYALEQDPDDRNLYYVSVYDNSYPGNANAIMMIDTTLFGGNGAWIPTYGRWEAETWGGGKYFYLRDPANDYLTDASLPKHAAGSSPFIVGANELQIYNTQDAHIVISDSAGRQTGYTGGEMMADVPGSFPFVIEDGSNSPPAGYELPSGDYSVVMNNFTADTVDAYFFTGNRFFSYERYGAKPTETDHLRFDGSMGVSNPDTGDKLINLTNLVVDTTDERMFLLRQFPLTQSDSVVISNPDAYSLDLVSSGPQKTYGVWLEYTGGPRPFYFRNDKVPITENTTHHMNVNWGDFAELQLTIYVDEGSDGTLDDTLTITNQVTPVEDERGSMIPSRYWLGQNYPNPFNGMTAIRYSLPDEARVTIGLYTTLGTKVATLVDERKPAGNYRVTFEAGDLPSGVYFYKLHTDNYIRMRKMVLIR